MYPAVLVDTGIPPGVNYCHCVALFFFFKQKTAYEISACLVGSAGTQDLPNSQLDRFLMKLSMGYPDLQSQIHILRDRSGEDPLTRVQAVADRDALCEAIRRVRAIHIADPVYDYIARLTEPTRQAEISYAVFCLKKKRG